MVGGLNVRARGIKFRPMNCHLEKIIYVASVSRATHLMTMKHSGIKKLIAFIKVEALEIY